MTRWTDRTWSPLRLCAKPCCALFYARTQIAALNQWPDDTRVLLGSDLFDSRIPDDVIRDIFMVMAHHPRLIFKVVTRNAYRLEQWFGTWAGAAVADELAREDLDWPCENVHLGVRAHNQESLEDQLGPLLGSPAVWRFVILDKVTELIDMSDVDCPSMVYQKEQVTSCTMCDRGKNCRDGRYNALAEGIDEVMLGQPSEDFVFADHDDNWRNVIIEQCHSHGVAITSLS